MTATVLCSEETASCLIPHIITELREPCPCTARPGLYLTGRTYDGRPVSITVKKGVLEVEGIGQEELDAIIDSTPGDVGIPIGNQSSQIYALLYLNKLDHLVKEGLRIRYYGRYMDDFYLIHENKDVLRAAREAIAAHLAERGLELNDKTQIFPLRNGLDFLGFHSYLTDTGKVVRKLRKASRERMKRKLRKYKAMYEHGAISREKITESYQSWRAHASHGDCHALIEKYDRIFNAIFERSENEDVSTD